MGIYRDRPQTLLLNTRAMMWCSWYSGVCVESVNDVDVTFSDPSAP